MAGGFMKNGVLVVLERSAEGIRQGRADDAGDVEEVEQGRHVPPSPPGTDGLGGQVEDRGDRTSRTTLVSKRTRTAWSQRCFSTK